MLDVKKLLTKILNRLVKREEVTFTVPALSAGAKGYWTVPISFTISGYLIAVQWWTSNIAASGGLQVSPVAMGNGYLYVCYYAPSAISANAVKGTFYVSYWGGVVKRLLSNLNAERGCYAC